MARVNKQLKAAKAAKKTGKKAPVVQKSATFDYEVVSGHSTALKKSLKETYDLANSIVNEAEKVNPKDFVELSQKNMYTSKFEETEDELDESDFELYQEIYEDLDQELEDKLTEIIDKNRKKTNWVKPPPKLEKLQKDYIRFTKKFKENNQPADYQNSLKQKKLILKHYSASDVPKG